MTEGRRRRPERPHLGLTDIDELLSEALPDLVVLDLDLRLDAQRVAPLVAVDGRGRLALVLLPEPGGDGSADLELEVLDALAFARRHLVQLAHHLAPSRLRADLEPQVVVIATDPAPRTVERLAPLLGRAVRLFEVRELETRGARGTYLVGVDAPPLAALAPRSTPEAFVAGLEASRGELARLALRRLARIDAEIECSATEDGLEWRYRGALLAALGDTRTRLEAAVPGHAEGHPVTAAGDVETLLDDALARYVELLGGAGDDGEELEQVEIVPAEAGALLTPEEIEAFRD